VPENHWRLQVTRRGLAPLSALLPEAAGATNDLDDWLDREDIPDGVPYLISPDLEYDIDLNRYFLRSALVGASRNTQLAAARDIRRFLDFLWCARGGLGWREAAEADHDAYWYWRRQDPAGPRVAGSTWNRELSMLNGFYAWAARRGMVTESPVAQRRRRPSPAATSQGHAGAGELTAAAQARDARRDLVEWLTPAQYRSWRDTGLRGYDALGLPGRRFRGRWAARNALFADLMVRTGMRLTEQGSLTALEIPRSGGGQAYHRFWLPAAIAKGGSARWVYMPDGIARRIGEYIATDRADVIEQARAGGAYDRIASPLIIEDPGARRPCVTVRGPPGSRLSSLSRMNVPGCWSARLTGLSPRPCGWGSTACRLLCPGGSRCSPRRTSDACAPGWQCYVIRISCAIRSRSLPWSSCSEATWRTWLR